MRSREFTLVEFFSRVVYGLLILSRDVLRDPIE